MKKSLLAILMLGAATAASAQSFSDYFTVSYHDKEIKDGETIYVTDRIDLGDMMYLYEADINVANKQDVPVACAGVFNYYQPARSVVVADADFWGYPALCYMGAAQIGNFGTQGCLPPGALDVAHATLWVPKAGTDTFKWQPHLEGAAADAVSTYTLTLVQMNGEDPDSLEDGESMTIYICYSEKDLSAVETIAVDNADVKYYDLQGRAVKAPQKGLYIRLSNGKAQKVIL